MMKNSKTFSYTALYYILRLLVECVLHVTHHIANPYTENFQHTVSHFTPKRTKEGRGGKKAHNLQLAVVNCICESLFLLIRFEGAQNSLIRKNRLYFPIAGARTRTPQVLLKRTRAVIFFAHIRKLKRHQGYIEMTEPKPTFASFYVYSRPIRIPKCTK